MFPSLCFIIYLVYRVFVFCVVMCVLSLEACDDPAKEPTACCPLVKANKHDVKIRVPNYNNNTFPATGNPPYELDIIII